MHDTLTTPALVLEIKGFVTGVLRTAAAKGLDCAFARDRAKEYLDTLTVTARLDYYEFMCDERNNPVSVVDDQRIAAHIKFRITGEAAATYCGLIIGVNDVVPHHVTAWF